jgi:hypothetical protein
MGPGAVADVRAMSDPTQQEVAALRRTIVRCTLAILAVALIVVMAALVMPAVNGSFDAENARADCIVGSAPCPAEK